MKNILILLLLTGSKLIYGQYLPLFTYLNSNCDTLKLRTNVVFPMGSTGLCPELSGFRVKQDDTAFVELFYDMSRALQAMGCTSTSTITYVFSSVSRPAYLRITTNGIFFSDTIFAYCDTTIAYCPTKPPPPPPKNTFAVYPNPFSNKFNVDIPANESGGLKVIICNALGRVVMVFDNIRENKMEIQANNLAAGVYTIYLFNKKELLASSKLIAIK